MTDPESPPFRSLLVLPGHALNPRTGGGQRTGVFFNALKQLGPTEIVILRETPANGAEEFFPGHAGVHHICTPRFPSRQRGGLALLRANLERFTLIRREYAPDPEVTRQIHALLTPEHRLVAYRYIIAHAVAGLEDGQPDTPPLFVDIDDRDEQKYQSAARRMFPAPIFWLFGKLVIPRLRQVVDACIRRASFVWIAAEEDRAGVAGLPHGVVPNVPFFDIPDDTPAPSTSQELLFVGTFLHRPNQDGARWFLRNCWPELHARHPQAVLRIVGLGNWGSLAAEFPDLGGVDYVGTVDEIGPEYARSRLVISPLFEGGGSKIKVIEACAFGRPVVASPHSLRGFGDSLPAAIPGARDAAEFIAACDAILSDPEQADTLGQSLRALQQREFSRQGVEQRIVDQIQDALAGSGRP